MKKNKDQNQNAFTLIYLFVAYVCIFIVNLSFGYLKKIKKKWNQDKTQKVSRNIYILLFIIILFGLRGLKEEEKNGITKNLFSQKLTYILVNLILLSRVRGGWFKAFRQRWRFS